MPKEKINYAPEYVQTALAEAGDDAVPGVQTLVAEVSNIPWTPVRGGEAPGAWVPDSVPVRRDAELVVGWNRDSWVQLSIEGDAAYFTMAATSLDGEVDGDTRTSVYTPPLSREELNKLIRVLRRARDQVFGRDE